MGREPLTNIKIVLCHEVIVKLCSLFGQDWNYLDSLGQKCFTKCLTVAKNVLPKLGFFPLIAANSSVARWINVNDNVKVYQIII